MVACTEDRPLIRGHRPILFTPWRKGVRIVQWRQGQYHRALAREEDIPRHQSGVLQHGQRVPGHRKVRPRDESRGGANLDIIYPKLKPKEVLEKYGFPLVSKEVSESIHDLRTNPYSKRSLRLLGVIRCKFQPRIPNKYQYLLNENYGVSAKCCTKLKKDPFKAFEKEAGLYPILGNMASESRLRETQYRVQGGCNVFYEDGKGRNVSRPLSIWLEQDVWQCIEKYDIPIADIYRKGAMRTGCMFCGYGCQFADDNRLRLVHSMYPKMYDMFMGYTNNGVTYREALRKVLAVNKLYLPDEQPPTLFDFG